MNKIIIGLTVLVLGWQVAYAQERAEEFSKISQNYQVAKHLAFDVEYQYFENSKATEPYEQLMGSVTKAGNLIAHKLGQMETVETEEYFFKVDHELNEMVLLGRKVGDPMTGALPMEKLDSILTLFREVKREMIGAEEARYTLSGYLLKSPIDSYELYFDVNTHWVTRLVMHIKTGSESSEQPRIEVAYSNYDTSSKRSAKELDYKNYLAREDGEWKPLPEYKTYDFVNQLF